MTDWTTMSPQGTAASRFEALRGRNIGRDDQLAGFFRKIAAGARSHDLGDESIYLAEELVRMQWSLGAKQQTALAMMILASFISGQKGSTRTPLGGGTNGYLGTLIASIAKAGGLNISVAAVMRDIAQLVKSRTFDHLVGSEGDFRPLIAKDGHLYQQRMLSAENHLIALIRTQLKHSAKSSLADAADQAIKRICARDASLGGAPITLSDEQWAAVRKAVTGPLAVVSGGPGTGKTAIIVAILRTAARMGTPTDRIALAGPTGKSVNRMAMSVNRALQQLAIGSASDGALDSACPEPVTLHRLLGFAPSSGRFFHHESNPLPAHLVIVDEASMIDLELMLRLMRALSPASRLVLLGDADQLPSVSAGAVFRDLVAVGQQEGQSFSKRLTRSYRVSSTDPSGRALAAAADAIRNGANPEFYRANPRAKSQPLTALRHQGLEILDTTTSNALVGAFLVDWYRRRFAELRQFRELSARDYQYGANGFDDAAETAIRTLFALAQKSRILTATRRFAAGSDAVNRQIHQHVLTQSRLDSSPDFYPGEPVLVLQNDYQRGLFNGDQGIVIRVRESNGEQHFRIVFPKANDLLMFPVEAIRAHLALSFAMTVHKSQGSEFDDVALVLPSQDMPLIDRAMVYTAVTRARRSAVIVGQRAILRKAIARSASRHSGVADGLLHLVPEPDPAGRANKP